MKRAKAVYRQKSTGDLYVITQGDLGRIVDEAGARYYLLGRVHRLCEVASGQVVPEPRPGESHSVLQEHYAHDLLVAKERFPVEFEPVPELGDLGNDPIEQLLAEYEDEGCDHEDVDFLIRASYRYVDTMCDSQVRCLLFAMARRLDRERQTQPLPAD